MRLILGGAYQGKCSWYLQQSGHTLSEVVDGNVLELDQMPKSNILNHLHGLIRRLLQHQINPSEWLEEYLERHPDAVILCDEIGCGVVPMTAEEREWRETTGRICCLLAKRAVRVDRVFCGIAMTLKKED
jgi:adenosylcobinamide kinase/adenosylcobinamide-phosphate guanylyltransferase